MIYTEIIVKDHQGRCLYHRFVQAGASEATAAMKEYVLSERLTAETPLTIVGITHYNKPAIVAQNPG